MKYFQAVCVEHQVGIVGAVGAVDCELGFTTVGSRCARVCVSVCVCVGVKWQRCQLELLAKNRNN